MDRPRRAAPDLPLPPGTRLTVIEPAPGGPPLTRRALAAIVNRTGWDHRRPTLFVVNDRQRATPTALLLSLIEPPLKEWTRARFVVATGSHPSPDRRELEAVFGRALLPGIRDRIIVHDARAASLVTVGRTARGTAVAVNPALFDTEAVVAIGSAEPHYFAGLTGGRKSLVPGLASFETIRQNHRMACATGARPLVLVGNPVHEDLEEACLLVLAEGRRRGVAAVESVVAVHRGRHVFFVDRGPIAGAAERALPAAADLWARCVPARFPVVVAEPGAPLDRDFYQALKAFEHGRHILMPGGVLVLAAACPRGLGPRHFVQLLEEIADPERFAPDFGEDYDLGAHKVANLLAHRREGKRLFLVAPAAPAELSQLARFGVRNFASLPEALREAGRLAAAGSSAEEARDVLLIREAGTVVPRIADAPRE